MSSDIKLDFQDFAPSTSTNGDGSASKATSSKGRSNAEQLSGVPTIARSEAPRNNKNPPNSIRGAESAISTDKILQLIGSSGKFQSQFQQFNNSPKGKNSGGWGLGYLSQYFDVTTSDVIQRIIWSIVPFSKTEIEIQDDSVEDELFSRLSTEPVSGDETLIPTGKRSYSYIERFIQSRPDLYGPTWISITLVFTIVVFSNLISFYAYHRNLGNKLMPNNLSNFADMNISEKLSDEELDRWHYSLDQLNSAASLAIFYVLVLPVMIWLLFWFRGCQKYYTIIEIICAYGYSLSVFVPVTALFMYQGLMIRYVIITIASLLSGAALTLSFLPVVRTDPNPKSSHLILVTVPLSQVAFAYTLHRVMLY